MTSFPGNQDPDYSGSLHRAGAVYTRQGEETEESEEREEEKGQGRSTKASLHAKAFKEEVAKRHQAKLGFYVFTQDILLISV
ncbi:unnamed protein product [marine sediment metagenome]|uniref:Uncharacterized protein n=1 Tax=marine sediment metagenome TaxID=412755 RepID=X1FGH1_9ZZZZ